MSDNRVMMSNSARSFEAQAQRVAEVIGDGSKVSADEFAGFSLQARLHLHAVAPERYAELQAELDRRAAVGRI